MKNKKILCLASHNDDETLSCGGTLKKFANQGAEIYLLTFTDGVSARYDKNISPPARYDEETGIILLSSLAPNDRRRTTPKVSSILGLKHFNCFDFPDNKMDNVPLLEVNKSIEKYLKNANLIPDMVLTHNPYCLNTDHKKVYEASITVFRGLPKYNKTKIMCYETLSSTEWNPISGFKPNCYVDVSNYISSVKEALDVYKDEMRELPHPRNWETKLIKMKLSGTECGVEFAERFMVLREVL